EDAGELTQDEAGVGPVLQPPPDGHAAAVPPGMVQGVVGLGAHLAARRRSPSSRAMRRVQLQGGARRPHARRTRCTLSVRPRAPTPQMGPYRRSSTSEAGSAPLPSLPPDQIARPKPPLAVERQPARG